MGGDTERTLSEGDVKAIASEIKSQLLTDFRVQVGRGVLGWAWNGFIILLILAALYGLRDKLIPDKAAAKVGALVTPTRVAEFVMPRAFTDGAVANLALAPYAGEPPADVPEGMAALIAEIDRRDREERG